MIYFKDFEEFYLIEADGLLWSMRQNKYLTPSVDKDGYLRHQLSDGNKKRYQCKVHRMVGLKYLPKCYINETIDHIDSNKQNNNVSNLRWMTRSLNSSIGQANRW